MSCPRCGRETEPSLTFCTGCGAPLSLRDEPAPRALDVSLALDRRTPDRTPAPRAARAAAPPAGGPEPLPPPPAPPALAAPDVRAASRSHWDLGSPALSLGAEPAGAPPEAAPPAPALRHRPPEPRRAAPPAPVAAPAFELPLPAVELPDAEVDAVEVHLRRARPGRRALAWALDVLPFAAAGAALARTLLAAAGGPLPARPLGPDGVLDLLAREAGLLAPLAALVVVALFVYATLAHALAGATLGKWIARIRVAGPDGGRPSLGRSAARSALAVLSAALLGLGFLAALFTRSGRALHDLGASTWVVEA